MLVNWEEPLIEGALKPAGLVLGGPIGLCLMPAPWLVEKEGNKANESKKHLGSSTEQNAEDDVVLLARGSLPCCHSRRRKSTLH